MRCLNGGRSDLRPICQSECVFRECESEFILIRETVRVNYLIFVVFFFQFDVTSCYLHNNKSLFQFCPSIEFELTFSGNHGVTNGIWNVLLYECNVSNDSGETAPSIEKTPRENWLQTAINQMRIINFRLVKQKKWIKQIYMYMG